VTHTNRCYNTTASIFFPNSVRLGPTACNSLQDPVHDSNVADASFRRFLKPFLLTQY